MTEGEFKREVFWMAERLYPMVARMLKNRKSPEDAIQEIMMKLWEKRQELVGHPNVPGFVVLTARRYCIDSLRQKRVELSHQYDETSLTPSKIGTEQTEWEELKTIVRKIVKDLPTQQAEVLMMRDLDGYEYVEIAEAMSLKVEHVRVLLSRARKRVSVKLKHVYDYE